MPTNGPNFKVKKKNKYWSTVQSESTDNIVTCNYESDGTTNKIEIPRQR